MDVVDGFAPNLYKYRDFENEYHIRIIEHNELFFSAPRLFNDPFDCNIPFELNVTEDQLREHLQERIKNDPDAPWQLQNRGQTAAEYIEQEINEYRHNPDRMRERLKQSTRQVAARHAIFSMGQSWDNLLMWPHYANCHKGFCIGLNTKSLFDTIWKNIVPHRHCWPFYVEYEDKYPQIDFINSSVKETTKIFSVKSKHWEYEGEVRIFLEDGAVNADGTPKKEGGTPYIFGENIIEEVTLGVKCLSENENKIISILQKRTIKPKLYRAIMKDKEFGLDRTEIPY